MYEDRIAKAIQLFREGFNCSQSVVGAFADLYGFTPEQACHISASFGGGIGRMRETCGAACGLFQLAGLHQCATVGADQAAKAANYALVQQLAARLKAENGSIICGVLLGLRKNDNDQLSADKLSTLPEARTAEYYKKRPCIKLIEQAARIWAEYLENHPVK
jgi:C_GCAxxG_C_C family probable redox protein